MNKLFSTLSILALSLIMISCKQQDIALYANFDDPSDVIEKSDFIIIVQVDEYLETHDTFFHEFDYHSMISIKNDYSGESFDSLIIFDDIDRINRGSEILLQLKDEYALMFGLWDEEYSVPLIYVFEMLPNYNLELSLENQIQSVQEHYMIYLELLQS